MLFAIGCVLFAIGCVLFTIGCVLFTIGCVLLKVAVCFFKVAVCFFKVAVCFLQVKLFAAEGGVARGIEAEPPATGVACAGDGADSPTRGAHKVRDEAARPNVFYFSCFWG